MSCKYNNCKHCGYKSECEIYKENAELKKEWQEQVQKATDEGYARTLQTMQLTKAKELLKRCYDTYVYEVSVRREIEQFLKDSEVEK